MKQRLKTNGPEWAIRAVYFDFGGVLAEEGFRNGLAAIARQNGLKEQTFVANGFKLVYEIGFVTGHCEEGDFWSALRSATSVTQSNDILRKEILTRFVLRPRMIDLVKRLKNTEIITAILSDQVNWLDELNEEHQFFRWFDGVFNSYHLGKSKKDPSIFFDVTEALGVSAHQALFVDDHGRNVDRAKKAGLKAILYKNQPAFEAELQSYLPFIFIEHE